MKISRRGLLILGIIGSLIFIVFLFFNQPDYRPNPDPIKEQYDQISQTNFAIVDSGISENKKGMTVLGFDELIQRGIDYQNYQKLMQFLINFFETNHPKDSKLRLQKSSISHQLKDIYSNYNFKVFLDNDKEYFDINLQIWDEKIEIVIKNQQKIIKSITL